MKLVVLAMALVGCGPQYGRGHGPCGDGPNGQRYLVNGACVDRLSDPRNEQPRAETVREERGIDGLRVTIAPLGAAGWSLRIENDSSDALSVLWDESSFVTSDGKVAGRLIRGETRAMDTGKPQPPEPLPSGAAVVSRVFAEKLIGAEQGAELAVPLVGGKLHLTIATATGKQTWTGVVEGQ